MKKILTMLFVAAALCIVVASCGDEKDEPDVPKTQLLESEHGVANDTYLVWNIDLNQDSSSINVYNAVFQMGDKQSPALNISIQSPCTVDKTGKVYTLMGSNIIPNLIMGSTPVPYPTLRVNNLKSVVDVEKKTYTISFDCQGTAMGKPIDGHYDKEGKLQ